MVHLSHLTKPVTGANTCVSHRLVRQSKSPGSWHWPAGIQKPLTDLEFSSSRSIRLLYVTLSPSSTHRFICAAHKQHWETFPNISIYSPSNKKHIFSSNMFKLILLIRYSLILGFHQYNFILQLFEKAGGILENHNWTSCTNYKKILPPQKQRMNKLGPV